MRQQAERSAAALSDELELTSTRFQSQIALLSEALAAREEAEQRRRHAMQERRRQQQAQMEQREQRGGGDAAAANGASGYGIGGMLGAIPTLQSVADGLAGAASSGLASLSAQNVPQHRST